MSLIGILKCFGSVIATSVLILASGCASYLPAVMPVDESSQVENQVSSTGENTDPMLVDGEPVAWVGSQIRIFLHSGKNIEGEVVHLTSTAITIGKIGNYGFEKKTIAVSEIATLEVRRDSKAASAIAGSVTMFLVVVLALGGLLVAGSGFGGNEVRLCLLGLCLECCVVLVSSF